MPNFLRFRFQGHKPRVGSDQVGLYVDADGALKQVDEEGTVSEVGGNGGSQPSFVVVSLRHSADLPNVSCSVLSKAYGEGAQANAKGIVSLPPTAFGDDATVRVTVYNDEATDQEIGGTLVVQSGDGTDWISQDGDPQTVPAGGSLDMDFPTSGGSGGSGLSWNAETKAVDIASSGAYSAFVGVTTEPS